MKTSILTPNVIESKFSHDLNTRECQDNSPPAVVASSGSRPGNPDRWKTSNRNPKYHKPDEIDNLDNFGEQSFYPPVMNVSVSQSYLHYSTYTIICQGAI